jgi:hypothetical protein
MKFLEPNKWTADDVKAWLLWTLRQYALPMISIEYFNMDGSMFVTLTEEDFQQRAPQVGLKNLNDMKFLNIFHFSVRLHSLRTVRDLESCQCGKKHKPPHTVDHFLTTLNR